MSKWKIADVELENQIVVAPMAGISNQAFRSVIKEMNPGLIYAEMVSTNGLLYDNKKTMRMLETHGEEHPLTMQVFGGDKEVMKEGAILVDKYCDADIIDVYEAMDMFLPGYFAYQSVLDGSKSKEIPDLRNKEERDKWRNFTACTDPKVAGDMLLPTRLGGTPKISPEVYDHVKKLWE